MGQGLNEQEQVLEPVPCQDDLERYRRLVQLQGELVDLARRHREAEQDYHSLRQNLEAEFRRRTMSGPRRLLIALLDQVRRLKGTRTDDGDGSDETTSSGRRTQKT